MKLLYVYKRQYWQQEQLPILNPLVVRSPESRVDKRLSVFI